MPLEFNIIKNVLLNYVEFQRQLSIKIESAGILYFNVSIINSEQMDLYKYKDQNKTADVISKQILERLHYIYL